MSSSSATGAVTGARLQIMHAVDRSLTITLGDHPLLTYHYGDIDRFPYCDPVNLPDGPAVTLARPFDHDWHLGLFFAWKYLNHFNVWEGVDAHEAYGGTRHVGFGLVPGQAETAGFWHELDWVTSDKRPLLRDLRVVMVRPSVVPNAYCIDWIFRFTPQVEEVVFDRKVEWGGYAGLSIRFPRSFYQPRILNADGESDSEITHRARAAWSDYSGWIDGQGKVWGGVTMIDHPANPRYPTPWLTYLTPHLQFLNAAFVRDEPFVLRTGQTLDLAYRVVIHWDVGDAALLASEAASFGSSDLAHLRAQANR